MHFKVGPDAGLWVPVSTIALLVAACSGSVSKPNPKPTAAPTVSKPRPIPAGMSGTLTGSARPCFGAYIPPAHIAALNITVRVDITNDRDQRVAQRILHARGEAAYRDPLPFSLALPVGKYTVSSPLAASQTIQITAGKTSHVALESECL